MCAYEIEHWAWWAAGPPPWYAALERRARSTISLWVSLPTWAEKQLRAFHVFLNRVQQTVSGNKPLTVSLQTPFAGHCLGALWGGKPCPAELSEGVNRVLRTLSGDPPLPIPQTPSAGHCLDTIEEHWERTPTVGARLRGQDDQHIRARLGGRTQGDKRSPNADFLRFGADSSGQLKTTSDVTSKFPWCCRASVLWSGKEALDGASDDPPDEALSCRRCASDVPYPEQRTPSKNAFWEPFSEPFLVRSEKLQNESSPNFSNFWPDFARILARIFQEFFVLHFAPNGDQKNSPKIPAVFQCKKANAIKIFTKCFWRAGKVMILAFSWKKSATRFYTPPPLGEKNCHGHFDPLPAPVVYNISGPMGKGIWKTTGAEAENSGVNFSKNSVPTTV